MDQELRFRTLLIKLQNSLSKSDRKRLHFLLGNVIPRRLRDDDSIEGTLDLLESLFDSGKIDNEDFDYLIQAFQHIDRHDIAQRLKAHSQEIRKNINTERSTLLVGITDDNEEDKLCSRQQDTIRTCHINNRLLYSDSKQSSTKMKCWQKILIVFNIICILVGLILLTIILLHKQGKKSMDSKKNCTHWYVASSPLVTQSDTVIVAYFTSWPVRREYFISNIPADQMTHLNYAFAKIDSNGEIQLADRYADVEAFFPNDTDKQLLRGNFHQLQRLKRNHPLLRTLITVGGEESEKRFTNIARTAPNRSKFAASCVTFVQQYDFDGIDISWFRPVIGESYGGIRRPEDKLNYVLLLKELRRQLNDVPNKKYLLTIQAGVTDKIVNLNLSAMANYLDWMNLMTYDFHGSWNTQTNHHAPLFPSAQDKVYSPLNCDAAIQTYIDAGVPGSKIVMGIPLYGWAWQGVNDTGGNGFRKLTSSSSPNGTWDRKGILEYDHVKKDFLPSFTRYFDNHARAPFLFHPSTGIWISYEDQQSIDYKAEYIKIRRLRGMYFWEVGADRETELIKIAHQALIPSTESVHERVT